MLRTPGLEAEVTDLSNLLRSKLFLAADSYFIDLTWELFSLFPSSLFTARQTVEKIRDLDPVVHTVNALEARIIDESWQLCTLRKEHDKADRVSSQLDADLNDAANVRDTILGLIPEQGESQASRRRLAKAERLCDHLFDLYETEVNEMNDLAEIIQTKTQRLAKLEVQRAELTRDWGFHARLLADLDSLESDLKILAAKIGAYFHFL